VQGQENTMSDNLTLEKRQATPKPSPNYPQCGSIDQSTSEAKRKAKNCLSAPSITHQPRAMEAFMRAHHVMAVVAVLVIGLGAKLYLFSPKQAEADVFPTGTMNVLQMHTDIDMKQLPQQKMKDKAIIFTEEE